MRPQGSLCLNLLLSSRPGTGARQRLVATLTVAALGLPVLAACSADAGEA